MSLKDKIIFILLSIITLGIYPLIIFNKKPKTQKDQLSVAKKVSINLEDLVLALGGKDNIQNCQSSHTKIKIYLKDRALVNLDTLKYIKGISGVVGSSSNVTIIVGNQAKELTQLLEQF